MEVKKTSDLTEEIKFLDIEVFKENNQIYTKIFDKRREYKFKILGMVSPFSNIPINMGLNIITSQLFRFAKVCSFKKDFIFNCKIIIDKLHNNGFFKETLRRYLNTSQNKHKWIPIKYNR